MISDLPNFAAGLVSGVLLSLLPLLAIAYRFERQRENEAKRAADPDLLEACKAWMRVESEMRENHPCPDLALRATYRKEAIRLTKAAIAKAKPKE